MWRPCRSTDPRSLLHRCCDTQRDLVQVVATKYLISVSQARSENNTQRLEELKDSAQFVIDVLNQKIEHRDSEREAGGDGWTAEELQEASREKSMAYQQSTETKWNKRPTSAAPARPQTGLESGGLRGEEDQLARPGTAPGRLHTKDIVKEMREAREGAGKFRAQYGAMVQTVEALTKQKEDLQKRLRC